jgi:DNA-binding NtrC family response regulator/tetratricopeptide (TPR) repeat protein
MRAEILRVEPAPPAPAALSEQCLDPTRWDAAWRRFLDEDYAAALELARGCLDCLAVEGTDRCGTAALPTVKDAVVLAARCLFQLERRADLDVLLASAGRWGLVSGDLPELEAIQLAFGCKAGEYARVVEGCSAWIAASTGELPPGIADFLYLRGLALSHLGEPERSREDAESAFALFRLLGRGFESARAANLLGIVAFRESRYDEAETWWRRAHELHAALGMIKNMGGNRLNLGLAAGKRGNFRRAESELQAAVRLLEQVGARVSLCRAGLALGQILRLRGQLSAARVQLLESFRQAGELSLPREEALALEFLGDVQRDDGRLDQALRYYDRAMALAVSIAPDGDIVMEVRHRQGLCLGRLGRPAEAVALLRTALGQARRLRDRFEEGAIRRALAESLMALADPDSAASAICESVRLLREVGAEYELAQSLLMSAELGLARFETGLVADPQAVLDDAWQDALSALHLQLRIESEPGIRRAHELVARVADRRQRLAQEPAPSVAGASVRHSARPVSAPVRIVHVSSVVRDLIQLTDAFADSDEPVLITGETGTGKELFARRLHERSRRRGREMVAVNVSAVPESLFAREFFGHVRGAYSGADGDGLGLAARADGGTLFLDEIGDLPLELQPRLLRLLQDGSYQAIGDPAARHADIRLVAATNADLRALVAAGRFRADLYYRLRILELKLPPLRERRDDILPLLRHLLSEAAGRPVELTTYFSQSSLERAQQHRWPGNVRELGMVARQAHHQLAACGRVQVDLEALDGGRLVLDGPAEDGARAVRSPEDAPRTGGRALILAALAASRGNRALAARRLGVSRSTLYRQMERLGIEPRPVGL